jgi:Putative peptidoglycan binding domain
MKNIRLRIREILLLLILTSIFNYSYAQHKSNSDVRVRGYYKSNGTYVEPHYRSAPNGTKSDNFSTYGNVNPYTGKESTIHIDNNYTNPYPVEEKRVDLKQKSDSYDGSLSEDLKLIESARKLFSDYGIDVDKAIIFNNRYPLKDRIIINRLVYKIIRNIDVYDEQISFFTITAIMQFQMDNGLKMDGKVGKDTFIKLLEVYSD